MLILTLRQMQSIVGRTSAHARRVASNRRNPTKHGSEIEDGSGTKLQSNRWLEASPGSMNLGSPAETRPKRKYNFGFHRCLHAPT